MVSSTIYPNINTSTYYRSRLGRSTVDRLLTVIKPTFHWLSPSTGQSHFTKDQNPRFFIGLFGKWPVTSD